MFGDQVQSEGNPTERETEEITGLWQSSLMNNHINVERYPIGQDRVIFMFKDGSQAWEAKDFLVKQERLELVTIESKEYFGKHSSKGNPQSSAHPLKSFAEDLIMQIPQLHGNANFGISSAVSAGSTDFQEDSS
ncbi:LDLR chaperone boca [Caerostris extrusa]|uniref:LDLR chaperone boca n=1 Tax=Caerostris extrusa TaxID=172846 RepID=A0AAV4ULD4_CAEEX|nr:LDLR chaperone boca [Caerostris extrusa]